MNVEQYIALSSFAFVASITPGPNNLMLMASGANFGFARTLPHLLGVGVGFMVMVGGVGILLMQLFTAYPSVYPVLQVVSGVYLLYLAWKIATAVAPEVSRAEGEPFTFLQAALFQWVNPKAWTMAITAVSLYAPSRELAAVAVVALAFGVVNVPCISTWTLMGTQVRRLLTNPVRLRWFNGVMALLLLGSMLPALIGFQPATSGL